MHHRCFATVDATRIPRGRVRQAQFPAWIRDRDLSVVHVAGEHELEASALEPVEDEIETETGLVGEAEGAEGEASEDESEEPAAESEDS